MTKKTSGVGSPKTIVQDDHTKLKLRSRLLPGRRRDPGEHFMKVSSPMVRELLRQSSPIERIAKDVCVIAFCQHTCLHRVVEYVEQVRVRDRTTQCICHGHL